MAARRTRKRRRLTVPRISRDVILFVFGIFIVIHEVWFTTGAARTDIILAALGMMGLPLFLWHGDQEHDGNSDTPSAATVSRSSGRSS